MLSSTAFIHNTSTDDCTSAQTYINKASAYIVHHIAISATANVLQLTMFDVLAKRSQ